MDDRLGDLVNEAMVKSLFDTLLEAEAESVDEKLCNLKVLALFETLADTLAQAENETVAMCWPRQYLTHWLRRLQKRRPKKLTIYGGI